MLKFDRNWRLNKKIENKIFYYTHHIGYYVQTYSSERLSQKPTSSKLTTCTIPLCTSSITWLSYKLSRLFLMQRFRAAERSKKSRKLHVSPITWLPYKFSQIFLMQWLRANEKSEKSNRYSSTYYVCTSRRNIRCVYWWRNFRFANVRSIGSQ